MRQAGLTPDPWQEDVLGCTDSEIFLLCSRQSGKSQVAAALAIKTAIVEAPSLVLVLSHTQRQSGELFREKILKLMDDLHWPVPAKKPPTQTELQLANGSRIVSLPENEEGIRGFSSVALLIIDEAARVDDALYYAVSPMLSITRGRLIALSTPNGKRGWFYEEWEKAPLATTKRIRVTAEMCSRHSPEFLARERLRLGPRGYRQEHGCSFESVVGATFDEEDIKAAISHGVKPLFSNHNEK